MCSLLSVSLIPVSYYCETYFLAVREEARDIVVATVEQTPCRVIADQNHLSSQLENSNSWKHAR
jgi:hypothetical protein